MAILGFIDCLGTATTSILRQASVKENPPAP